MSLITWVIECGVIFCVAGYLGVDSEAVECTDADNRMTNKYQTWKAIVVINLAVFSCKEFLMVNVFIVTDM